jgi:hypothetical protein
MAKIQFARVALVVHCRGGKAATPVCGVRALEQTNAVAKKHRGASFCNLTFIVCNPFLDFLFGIFLRSAVRDGSAKKLREGSV